MGQSSVDTRSRREFLKLIAGAGLVTSAPGFARAADLLSQDVLTISILHTTDLHGHILPTTDYVGHSNLGGMARCVTQIKQWRQENPHSLVIDVGDVYQGTDVAFRDRGELMIDLFNLVGYDAWIVGNHEFDWGIEPFVRAVDRSNMPVLGANIAIGGKPAGDFAESGHPLRKLRPYILKEIAGIRIAVIGVTTPGMPYWFRPEFTDRLEFRYPVESVRRAIAAARSEGANAFVLAGHMGLKDRLGGDDFANNVMALTSEFPELSVFIAGHTHQDIPSRRANRVLFTQADHFGIHAGRIDLTFDRASKRLLHAEARSALMDDSVALDAVVLGRAKAQLDASATVLAEPVGRLADTLSARSTPGRPSDVELMIGAAITEALAAAGVQVDAVMHGVFDDKKAVHSGDKTIADIWQILPFENFLITAELTAAELTAIMEEAFLSHEGRNLMGLDVVVEGSGKDLRVTRIGPRHAAPAEPEKRYRIAFNTFDSRSAGHRFMKLRDVLDTAAANTRFHHVQTRDALIDYFRRHKVVRRIRSRRRDLPAAA